MKVIIYSLAACAIVLVVITAILLKLNWSSKIISPVVSIFFVGTVTTLITIFFTLKESKDERTFMTSIVVDSRSNIPFITVPNHTNEKQVRQFEIVKNGAQKINYEGSEIKIYDTPKDFNETKLLLQELLLYDLLKEIQNSQYQVTGVSQTTEGVKTFNHKPYKPPEAKNYKSDLFIDELNKFRFYKNNPTEKFFWETQSFTFPKGTKLTINLPKDSTDSAKTKLIIRKKHFFEIEISIETFGATGKGNIPENLNYNDTIKQECQTYSHIIELQAKFDKISAENQNTENYKKWINYLFNRFEYKFSD